MLDILLQFIAPHYCYGCNITGTLLCNNCKYDIISDPFDACINCRKPTRYDGVCVDCRGTLPYSKAWVVGERSDVLRHLLDDYKFERRKSANKVCADLLDSTVSELPSETIVTFIPTSNKHIRQRGYDHAELVAKRFAKHRGLDCRASLVRDGHSVQHGATRMQRIKQAAVAYSPRAVRPDVTYLLIDDIFTTGATMDAASRLLIDSGAKEVWLGIIARQPLDSRGKI